MPVTIKEMTVNTTVQESASGGGSSGSSQGSKDNGSGNKQEAEVIINECIRRVLEEIEYKFGR